MKQIEPEALIGTFDIVSGEVFISDPCYGPGTWRQGKLKDVKKGRWLAYVHKEQGRVAQLLARHESASQDFENCSYRESFDVGVDSGQAGIFDSKHYQDPKVVVDTPFSSADRIREEESWYSLCCDRTLGSDGAGTIPYGVVSSSGWGDGSYICYTHQNKEGQINMIKIDYLGQEEDQ